MRPIHRFALAAWAFAAGLAAALPSVAADRNSSAPVVDSAAAVAPAAFKLPAGSRASALRLERIDEGLISQVRRANASSVHKKVQIGIGRPIAQKLLAAAGPTAWDPVPGGGYAARWELTSPGALGLRVELAATGAAPGSEVRFAGTGRPDVVYGPYPASDFAEGAASRWSPVLEGEGAIIEAYVASLPPDAQPFAIPQVSHLFVGPWQANAESLAKASQSCEVDFICRAASDAALAQTGRTVAKMTFSDGTGSGSQFLCTGTLLNPIGGSGTPYFYSANHCISTQASASTLATHWFYDRSGCGSGTTGASYVQVSGGATLLYANEASDALLLRLNSSPPSGAILSGWDAATVSTGAAATAVHHPAGDWKKVSLATIGGFGSPDNAGSDFIVSNWNSTATGVTEGGSSGSGLFTFNGSEYVLRGGLYGGPSSCSAPQGSLFDYYSRFDQVYPAIAQYLNPVSCSFTLSPNSVSVLASGGSGSFSVTAPAGCMWIVSSSASWLTASGSGSANGTVSYSVAANSGAARTATITVGGVPFTVTQQAAASSGANFLGNPGFETGTASWSQSASISTLIITQQSAQTPPARSGSWFAWLGGYSNAVDTLYQVVTVPAGGSLRFWYRIETNETTTTTAFDTLAVMVADASSGATLATLATFSNLNTTSGYVQSPAYDLSAFAGRTVRLVFLARTDGSENTNFLLDDLEVATSSGAANYTALWWNPSESGWGINLNHQGGTLFATLFTYDASGNPLWLVMSNGVQSGESFSGTLYRTTGPAFDANPFTPIGQGNISVVGDMTLSFSGGTGTLAYSMNGITVVKSIQKQVFGSRAANCVGTTGDRSALTNYQDLWWNPSESGWGINLTHQDNTIFATLFTYSMSGQGIWWVMSAGTRQSDGSYFGTLYQTTGSPFNANPFTPIGPGNISTVGTMRLAFTSGTAGTLTYTVNGVTVTKSIVRQVFGAAPPACS